jgi:hypothetical protein
MEVIWVTEHQRLMKPLLLHDATGNNVVDP